MNKFFDWMEKYFVPIAAKIGGNRFLISIRDGFITMMPVVLAGSFAVLLNALVRDIPAIFENTTIPAFFNWLITINGNVWWGSLATFSLIFSVSLGYQLCKNYGVDPIVGALVAFGANLAAMPQGKDGWGFLHWSYTNTGAIFAAMILTIIGSFVFIGLSKTKFVIKLPEGVPPAVSRAFTALIPGIIAIYSTAVISYLFTLFTKLTIYDAIAQFIQAPAQEIGQQFWVVLLVVFLVQLFWFFGLHGANMLGAVLNGVYVTAGAHNVSVIEKGAEIAKQAGTNSDNLFLWVNNSFEVFVWMGGAGCTLGLVIALLIFCRKPAERAVATISAPMGVFNINEPVIFGIPLVLNPLYFIPFIFVPMIQVTIAYWLTYFGIIPPVTVLVPWIVPPVLGALMGTKSLIGALVALVNLAISVVIYSIFVIAGNRMKSNVEEEVAA